MQIEGTIVSAEVSQPTTSVSMFGETRHIASEPRKTKLTIEVVGDTTAFMEEVFRSGGKISLRAESVVMPSLADAFRKSLEEPPLVDLGLPVKQTPKKRSDVPATPSDW